MGVRFRRFTKRRMKFRNHLWLPSLIPLKSMPDRRRFPLVFLNWVWHGPLQQEHYELDFAQERLFLFLGLPLLNPLNDISKIKLPLNFGKNLCQHRKQLRYPIHVHTFWKLPIHNFILFPFKIIVFQNMVERRYKSLQNFEVITLYFQMMPLVHGGEIICGWEIWDWAFYIHQILDWKLECVKILTKLVDVMALVEYNYWVFKWDPCLRAQLFVDHVVVGNYRNVTVLNLSFHQVVGAHSMALTYFDVVFNRKSWRLWLSQLGCNLAHFLSNLELLIWNLVTFNFIATAVHPLSRLEIWVKRASFSNLWMRILDVASWCFFHTECCTKISFCLHRIQLSEHFAWQIQCIRWESLRKVLINTRLLSRSKRRHSQFVRELWLYLIKYLVYLGMRSRAIYNCSRDIRIVRWFLVSVIFQSSDRGAQNAQRLPSSGGAFD